MSEITPYTLIDAEECHRAAPETFDLPDAAMLDGVRPGGFVKIGAMFDPERTAGDTPAIYAAWAAKVGSKTAAAANAERFWVKVTARLPDGRIEGEVNNELVYTAHHGLRLGDVVRLERRHAIDVMNLDG